MADDRRLRTSGTFAGPQILARDHGPPLDEDRAGSGIPMSVKKHRGVARPLGWELTNSVEGGGNYVRVQGDVTNAGALRSREELSVSASSRI